jgi:hypothetical protein
MPQTEKLTTKRPMKAPATQDFENLRRTASMGADPVDRDRLPPLNRAPAGRERGLDIGLFGVSGRGGPANAAGALKAAVRRYS